VLWRRVIAGQKQASIGWRGTRVASRGLILLAAASALVGHFEGSA
jgi:hypothetical protein